MRVQFMKRGNGPERMVCEAEIHMDEGELAGMKLVGFSIWKSPDGELYVTFPARAFGAGSDRRYFDYLRTQEPGNEAVKRVKTWILESLRAGAAEQGVTL